MSALTEMLQKILVSHFPVVRIQLVDVLDIAILSLLIYKLMWMLRKSSSGRLLRGIGILLAAMVLSSAIQLTAVSYLLDQVVERGTALSEESSARLDRTAVIMHWTCAVCLVLALGCLISLVQYVLSQIVRPHHPHHGERPASSGGPSDPGH